MYMDRGGFCDPAIQPGGALGTTKLCRVKVSRESSRRFPCRSRRIHRHGMARGCMLGTVSQVQGTAHMTAVEGRLWSYASLPSHAAATAPIVCGHGESQLDAVHADHGPQSFRMAILGLCL